MSMLGELYNGNITPSEKYIKNGGEYQRLNKELAEHIEELMCLLNSEEKQLYQKIEDIFLSLNNISERESFVEGFRIGAQMMWEVMHYKSTDFCNG